MRTSLATLPPTLFSTATSLPRSVVPDRSPTVSRSRLDAFEGDAPLRELLAGNLAAAFRDLGGGPANVRAGADLLTRHLLDHQEHESLDALVKSGALKSELQKLPKGQPLVLTQRFSSMDEAKRTLGLTAPTKAPSTKGKKKKPASFLGKVWNVITREPKKKQPFWKKALGVVGASVAFSLFDYVAFNIARKHDKVGLYRPLQVTAQAGLTFLLKEQFGWKTAGAFNALWWTFNHDLMYYGWAHLLNPGNGWDSRPAFKGVLEDKVTWAWWTPAGLVNMLGDGKMRDPIKGKTLLVQAGVGVAVALTLLGLD
ncbi:MAG: hypothetical protein JNJ54_30810 [Myxococcaceae bacterium]|nr:hypothetical protein [Myxococcaceae bacterium]